VAEKKTSFWGMFFTRRAKNGAESWKGGKETRRLLNQEHLVHRVLRRVVQEGVDEGSCAGKVIVALSGPRQKENILAVRPLGKGSSLLTGGKDKDYTKESGNRKFQIQKKIKRSQIQRSAAVWFGGKGGGGGSGKGVGARQSFLRGEISGCREESREVTHQHQNCSAVEHEFRRPEKKRGGGGSFTSFLSGRGGTVSERFG